MKSASAVSFELDDPEGTARELCESIQQKLTLKKNSFGVLFCDADTDGAALTASLKELLGIETAGMTTLAALDSGGRKDASAVLTVFTADDCAFFPSVSDPLGGPDSICERIIAETCARVMSPDSSAPALIFAFCPSGMGFSGDVYPRVISGIAPGVPVIGGAASDDYDYKRARVFLSGKEYKDSLVLLGIRGKLSPVFALRHVTSRFAERIRRVVEAEKNVVYRVGDETFVKYLEGFGLKTDVEDPLLAFTSYPMMLTREEKDETPLMRHISALNLKDGSGTFFGDVPAGTLANICLVNKEDVMAACRESMRALLDEGKNQKDREYGTVLCISCCGRAMILGSDPGAEGRILSEMLPPGLTLFGAYCLGEICPVRCKDGDVSNRFHNCSIAFCMF
ncbi:MAG: FIST C-terminal domain-containing protein [Spirochaetaceae bacterium]|jgi:hypothetical protein|nr:FIST C-terminal domain-containing protein [Spirochaetaceae bacterium]